MHCTIFFVSKPTKWLLEFERVCYKYVWTYSILILFIHSTHIFLYISSHTQENNNDEKCSEQNYASRLCNNSIEFTTTTKATLTTPNQNTDARDTMCTCVDDMSME